MLLTLLGFIWSITLLRSADITPHYVAGHVLLGLTAICACLIGLVATIVHQTRNTFSTKEHWLWCYWVIFLGSITVLQGIYVLVSSDASARLAPGIILICLGMICYSIFSKVWLLALVWRRTCSLANRIPMIPVFTCLFCLSGIVSCGNGADRYGIFYSFAGSGRFGSGMLYVVLNRFNIRSGFC